MGVPAFPNIDVDLPTGIHLRCPLPNPQLGILWDSIIIAEKTKSLLLSQAMLNFTVRAHVNRNVLPLHGVILLVGLPGTGKTSLARGVAHRTAESFPTGSFTLLEVEPHSLTSSAMGKTQRAVSDLFSQSIAEAAIEGPTIVLLDEVETLAADRTKMSLESNPIDVHRATDAVLVQLDVLADRFPQLLFLATSNFPEAVDSAFTSRCDLIVQIPLPDRDACRKILTDCFSGLAKTYPNFRKLIGTVGFDRCAEECVGLDGRAIRKMVANAMASSPQTALDPNKVTIEQLLSSVRAAKENRAREMKLR